VPGVTKTTVGYTGGHTDKPNYEDGNMLAYYKDVPGAVEMEFDPLLVSYETLLKAIASACVRLN